MASVQASARSPVDNPETLLRLARASIQEGVALVRLEGVKNIKAMKPVVGVPVIGLLKRSYPGSEIYITPAAQDVDSLLDLGCEIVALDGTGRERPFGHKLADLIERIHRRGALAMADCDSVESAIGAALAGADLVGTTLAGYTSSRAPTDGPDLELLREVRKAVRTPIIAEGRYSQRWQVEAALRIGAAAVVIGGALNDPVKQTKALRPLSSSTKKDIGAVDIGGTWLRFARFTPHWELIDVDRTANPQSREDRLEWIRGKIRETGVDRIGLGTGGVTDPRTGEVWTAKEYLMPDQIGIVFSEKTLGVPTYAHGDGHASAWGHANLPQFAGRRVATLALGTGVGCGFVFDGKVWAGRRGEYPRANDLWSKEGKTFEDRIGGLHLTHEPGQEQKQSAMDALAEAADAVRSFYFPDDLVVCGSVGLSEWMAPALERNHLIASPFGHDAGLYGAAALALFPDYL